nr:hypothetical protein [Tanacetum cinerariifolium]
DDNIFSTIKVVSRHQDTQQYGAILPIELTYEDIRNTTAYKEYYAYANRVAALKPKASARKKRGDSDTSLTPPIATLTPITTAALVPRLSAAAKGKQPARVTTPTEPTDVERTEAEQLKIVLRRSRQETHISQQRGSSTDEGTGSRPGVPGLPSDDSEEDLSWNSSDDEDVDEQTKGSEKSEGDKTDERYNDDDDHNEAEKVNDDDDNEEEVPKIDEQEVTESDEGDDEATESDRESEDEETREQEEESFDPIPRTPEDNEDDDNNEEDQGLRIGEEERMQKEEDAEELYRDVDINQGWGLQVSQEAEDSHVILTPTQSDAQQESSSTSSFMTNMLNPITDPGMESIFTTGSTTGECSSTPTKPHHTPSPEADASHPTTSSIPLPSIPTAPIPPVTQPDTTPIRQYSRRARIAQSFALPTVVDEPASPVRDVSKGEACLTDSGFIADQDRATIAKSSTLPHDSAPRVTSPVADEGSMQHNISELTALFTSLQRQYSELQAKFQAQEEEIVKLKERGRSINEGDAAAERISNDSEEIARVLTSMDAATVLAGGIDVPTGSGFIPTAGPSDTVISTGSKVGPTASPIATRRKGKEVMVESDTPKKKKLQEQIDAQVEDFIPTGSKEETKRLKKKGLNLKQEQVKKQKLSEEAPEIKTSFEDVTEEKIKEMIQLVPVEDVYVQALQVKHPIID